MTLVPVDPKNEASVVVLLERVHEWLLTAVERSDATEIAAVKAQIATAAEATKQLNLSKEIQLDAQEMVRRAEYALGKAIRKGQAEGTIRTKGEKGVTFDRWSGVSRPSGNSKSSPMDFATESELIGGKSENNGIYGLAEATPQELETALESSRDQGNLSRANVVRNVRVARPASPSIVPTTRDQRADLIADLAAQGYASRQMSSKVGVTEETVRQIARDFNIEIPADRTIARTRRINPNLVVENTATALEGLVMGIEAADFTDVDPSVASQWVDSLEDSLKKLRGFVNQIRKATQ